MASKAANKRLTKEYVTMQREPPPFVWAVPDEKNVLTWNFLIRGPPESPYAGGEFHGVLLFPPEYPFKPPGIKMFTPSGRFHPDKKICFSMSDFHPGSWNPAWSVATILTGLLSFMLSDEMTTGSVTSTDAHKRVFAARSHMWNLQQAKFKEAFPEYCTPELRDLPNMGEREWGQAPASPSAAAASASSPVRTQSDQGRLAQAQQALASLAAARVDAAGAAAGAPTTANANANGKGIPTGTGWTAGWRQLLWDKWRWGALIALAVIVSRITSS